MVKQGVAYCWGDNSAQEVGSSQVSTVACDTLWPFAERKCVPALARVELPADAGSVVEVAASSSSHHACAVTSKKELWCWGFNGHGEVKMPPTLQEGPTRVLDGIEHAAAGGQFVGRTCAVDAMARVWCWGGVGKVSLLDGGPCNSDNACPPRLVAADGGSLLASDIELGDSNACAVTLDGLRCFGDNRAGQSSPEEGLEDKPSPSPPEIGDAGPLDGPYQLTMGLVTTCLRTPTAVICFGNNTAGQLGTLDQAQRKVRLPTRRLLVAGGLTTFALDRPGGGSDVVSAWGANVLGVLGHVPGQPNDVDAGSTFAFVVGNGAFPIPF